MPRRLALLSGLLAAVVCAVALSACGSAADSKADASASAAIDPLPTRNPRAQAVEPVAGESAADAALQTADPSDQPTKVKATAAALPKIEDSAPTKDAAISDAEVLKGGLALPPIEAPQAVHDIIDAGNQIARTPYLWGGGHGKWIDHGYDCSGSVSYALAAGGLLAGPLDSGRLMGWGKPGKGKWVTIYTNPTHVFMVVAGVRFDTGGTRTTGSRWQSQMRPTSGFVVRHPAGL